MGVFGFLFVDIPAQVLHISLPNY